MWKEAVLVSCKVLSRHLTWGTDEKHEKHEKLQSGNRPQLPNEMLEYIKARK
jgi:hypothetical protein